MPFRSVRPQVDDVAPQVSVAAQEAKDHPLPTFWGRLLRNPLLQRFSVPILLVLLWQLVYALPGMTGELVPSPSRVMVALREWAVGEPGAVATPFNGTMLESIGVSAWRVLIGYLIAVGFGVSLGILIGWILLAENLLDPLVQLLRPIPITAWVPLAIAIYGLRDSAAYFLIALGSFFPIVLNSAAGARGTPRNLVRAALMLGTGRRELLFRVVLPAALPSVFTGLRLGIGIAWILVIVAEMLAVRSGIGYVLWTAYNIFRMDFILAMMVTTGVLGFCSDRIVVWIGNRLLRWSKGL